MLGRFVFLRSCQSATNLAVSIELGICQRRSVLTQSVVDGLLHENTLRYSKYLYIDPSISVSPEYLLVLMLQDVPYRRSYDRKVIQAEASYRKVFCDQAS